MQSNYKLYVKPSLFFEEYLIRSFICTLIKVLSHVEFESFSLHLIPWYLSASRKLSLRSYVTKLNCFRRSSQTRPTPMKINNGRWNKMDQFIPIGCINQSIFNIITLEFKGGGTLASIEAAIYTFSLSKTKLHLEFCCQTKGLLKEALELDTLPN